MNQRSRSSPSPWAQGLGYGGLIPFVGLASAVWFLEPLHQARAASALLAYGASILSFLGAIHWGLTMRVATDQGKGMLAWGVLPSLVAWIALMLPASSGLLLVAALLWICFAVDRAVYPRLGLHAWLPMRLLLTVLASGSCVAGAWRLIGAAA
jgi:hypothetical protein